MTPFRYRRRVHFHETDLAGIVHFSSFFKYMEEAEHALWRAAGLTIPRVGAEIGWPRVSAAFDFRSPLRFEDEFEVIVRIATISKRTIEYVFEIVRGDERIGEGSLTAACVSTQAGRMRSVAVPDDIAEKLRAASKD